MRGAAERLRLHHDLTNRLAYNVATMIGPGMRGKLPPFEKVFREKLRAGPSQTPAQIQAMADALVASWGAS